jgi:hypothetical protein
MVQPDEVFELGGDTEMVRLGTTPFQGCISGSMARHRDPGRSVSVLLKHDDQGFVEITWHFKGAVLSGSASIGPLVGRRFDNACANYVEEKISGWTATYLKTLETDSRGAPSAIQFSLRRS